MKLFYCYSPKLKKFLVEKGVTYLHSGKHRKTHRVFWVFEGGRSLEKKLDLWRSTKPNNE